MYCGRPAWREERRIWKSGGSRWPSKEARLLADGPDSLDKTKRKKKLLIANKSVLETYQEAGPTQMFAVATGRHSLFLRGYPDSGGGWKHGNGSPHL